jgi:hypothetical protein
MPSTITSLPIDRPSATMALITASPFAGASRSTNDRSILNSPIGRSSDAQERRVAFAEIVDADPDAEIAQLLEIGKRALEPIHQRAFGHFQRELIARNTGGLENLHGLMAGLFPAAS